MFSLKPERLVELARTEDLVIPLSIRVISFDTLSCYLAAAQILGEHRT